MAPPSKTVYPALFTRAVARVLANEDHRLRPAGDPRGPTKFGISHRDYPGLDLAILKRDGAIAIYFRDFWKAGRYGDLPPAIAIKLFDLSVNLGAADATRCLQRALRACGSTVREDAAIGNGTVAAAKRVRGGALLAALRSEAAGHYRSAGERIVAWDASCTVIALDGWLSRAYQ
jgi:lysozyme family protein